MKMKSRSEFRARRRLRIRQKISGTAERPRMSIMLSNRHLYVQFVDDDSGVTLASASDGKKSTACNVETATLVGKAAAEAALAKGIKRIIVDRSGYAYHGRVKAVVESALNAGLSV